ncbi:transcriptional repressor [Mycobacterium phage LittleCherry]|uniref:Immunity repressor n=4 Tax=Caudoviricetes TaxID=2731619 RepID=G1JUP3_9CAUD|nr:transcriptional repressor [Mycobacterium phage LittleCherry]YP_009208954.1 transcriptional repressor [Mycobacterium phage Swirley]YP_009635827.1 transcriptional repressor [Mycobacterium phage George]YP_009638155.1 transcriptional repressor [Mycobacterium phage Cuco]AVR76648.1 immunity repressor [Mycobacterium phage Coog]AVR77193.1 immunity repressor [Mycobacterium phage Midas2]AXC33889.1 immunity repressor [Mycobacterium phage Tarynearal]QAX92742.1 immunity repressor [Mycobacterium phage 
MTDQESILIELLKLDGLSPEPIRILRDTYGWTYADIARHVGKTRQAVSFIAKKYIPPTPRQEVIAKAWPFNGVSGRHLEAYQYRMLRHHAEYMATNGDGMKEIILKRLRGFYNKLHEGDFVVEYDPAIPPCEDNIHGGWAYRPREEKDGNLIVRENEHTHITEEGMNIWVYPKIEP